MLGFRSIFDFKALNPSFGWKHPELWKVGCFSFAVSLGSVCWHSDLLIGESGQGSNFCFLATRCQQRKECLAPYSSCFRVLGAPGEAGTQAPTPVSAPRKGGAVWQSHIWGRLLTAQASYSCFTGYPCCFMPGTSCIHWSIHFLICSTSNHT